MLCLKVKLLALASESKLENHLKQELEAEVKTLVYLGPQVRHKLVNGRNHCQTKIPRPGNTWGASHACDDMESLILGLIPRCRLSG